jgi:hypothetical protein
VNGAWRIVLILLLLVTPSSGVVPQAVEFWSSGIDAALREAANPDLTLVVLPGAPHNFVLQPNANGSLKWPRLYPGYADLLVAWIRYRMGQPP